MRTLRWLRKIYINRYSPSLRIWRLNDVKVLSVFSHVLVFWYFSVFYELWMNGWIDSTLHFLSFIVKQSQKNIASYSCMHVNGFIVSTGSKKEEMNTIVNMYLFYVSRRAFLVYYILTWQDLLFGFTHITSQYSNI